LTLQFSNRLFPLELLATDSPGCLYTAEKYPLT